MKLIIALLINQISSIKVRDILAQTSLEQEAFNELFIRSDGLNHLLLSDSERIMSELQA